MYRVNQRPGRQVDAQAGAQPESGWEAAGAGRTV